MDDVNEKYTELAEESNQEAQEFLKYFSVAKNWLPLYKILYHGSNVPPERILKQGLKSPFLTPDEDIARNYGEYIYEVDVEKMPPEMHLSPGWGGESQEMASQDDIPSSIITLSNEKGIKGSGTTKGKTIAEEVKSEGEVHVSAHTREGGKVDVVEHTRSLPTRDGKYEYSSTQVNLPENIAQVIKDFTVIIPEYELAGDGREKSPHITVKYGLHENNPEQVRNLLKKQPMPKAVLLETAFFAGVENGTADAVILNVNSPELIGLNKLIAILPHTDTYSEYKPHITLAYVKLGLGEKYAGNTALKGTIVTFPELTYSGKDGVETHIPFLPRNSDPSIALSDEYEFDYFLEDADYTIEDEKYKLGVWTSVQRWRGEDVEGLEVQAYKGPDGKRMYRTRVKKKPIQTPPPSGEEKPKSESDEETKYYTRIQELREKYDTQITSIHNAEASLSAVRKLFAEGEGKYLSDLVGTRLDQLVQHAVKIEVDIALFDGSIRNLKRRMTIRGNRGLLLAKEETGLVALQEMLEIYEDASDKIQAMTKLYFTRYDEWKNENLRGSLNTELDNWNEADRGVKPFSDDMKNQIVNATHNAMSALNKIPSHLRHSLQVFKDGVKITNGSITQSQAYPMPTAEADDSLGIYMPYRKETFVKYQAYGMANTIVHEIAHGIVYEVLGISKSYWEHGFPNPSRLGRDFQSAWRTHLSEFSEYGQTSFTEGFAEAFTEYVLLPWWMKTHHPNVHAWFEKNIGKSTSERKWEQMVQQAQASEKLKRLKTITGE